MDLQPPPTQGEADAPRTTVAGLPAGLGPRQDLFVGRQRELQALLQHVDEATAGKGRFVLITGEAGIGKTRLATELARTLATRDMRVLWSRCGEDQSAAPHFWPWVQIFRAYLRDQEWPDSEKTIQSPSLAQLLPELLPPNSTNDPQSPPSRLFSNEDRFRLLDAASRLLIRLTRDHPTLLVVEDIHWADPLSLLFTDFLLDEIQSCPVLILATFRSSELHHGIPLPRGLERILKHPKLAQIHLTGLSLSDVMQLLPPTGDSPLRSRQLLSHIYSRTRGNPFFVTELIRAIPTVQSNSEFLATYDPPHTLIALVEARLRPISAKCRHLLACASVIGTDFDRATVVQLFSAPPDSTGPLFDEAYHHELVLARHDSPGTYSFAHAIIRDVLYRGLTPSTRASLHLELAKLLEQRLDQGDETLCPSVSHHYFHALETSPEAGPAALTYSLRAGDAALAANAYEDAILQYQRALKLLAPACSTQRCQVLVNLGDSLTYAGDWQGARTTFHEAFLLAKRLSEPILLARAAMGLKGMGRGALPPNYEAIDALRFALTKVSKKHQALHAQLLTALSTALYFAEDKEKEQDANLSSRAVKLAEASGSPRTLGDALEAHVFNAWNPTTIDRMLHRANKLLNTGLKHHDCDLEFRARISRYVALTQLEDPAANAELLLCHSLAGLLRNPRYLWQVQLAQATQALIAGNLRAAESLAEQTHLMGRRFHDPTADHHLALHYFARARLFGSVEDFAGIFEPAIAAAPQYPLPRVGYAYYLAATGRPDLSRSALGPVLDAQDAHFSIPKDAFYLFTLCVLAETAILIEDLVHVAQVRSLLTPYANQIAICGWGSAVEGSISHFIGILDMALGAAEGAEYYLQKAITSNSVTGFELLRARSATQLASHWLKSPRGNEQRTEAISALLLDALRIYERSEILVKAAETQTLIDANLNSQRAGNNATRQTVKADFRMRIRKGEYCIFETPTSEFQIRTSKGIRQLAELLANPGAEYPALFLASLECNSAPPTSESLWSGRAGGPPESQIAVLDHQAISEYRQRIKILRTHLDDAREQNNLGQVDAYQAEIEWLEHTLSSAVGLAGRVRSAPNALERARISVRNNLANAFNRIARFDEDLAAHLRRSIRTGVVCSYVPMEAMTGSASFET